MYKEQTAEKMKIRPLEIQVRQMEENIAELEAEQAEENQRLIKASQDADIDHIQKLNKSRELREKELDGMYERVIDLEKELESLRSRS